MRRSTNLRIIALLCLTNFGIMANGQNRVVLNEGWKFRKANTNNIWLNASVPSTVHSDLLKNGTIANPHEGCNHKELEWIEQATWEYSLDFELNESSGKFIKPELVFEGLDTRADVYLNGNLALKANNMHRTWSVDITEFQKTGKNNIRVVFYPVSKYIAEQKSKLDFKLPGDEWAYIRKAAYQFGWDFAPRILTSGIWKPVYIQESAGNLLNDGIITTKSIVIDTAFMQATFSITTDAPQTAILKVANSSDQTTLQLQEVELGIGDNKINIDFEIIQPRLWWPNGMGNQNLYSLDLVLVTPDGVNQKITQSVGIRTIELVNKSDLYGTSFFFKVNGNPLFVKGANIVPPHSFEFNNASDWVRLVEEAHQVNMNMLRVWGGGIYPPDEFFAACDRLGILVWQDFMFACSMYPWDEDFIANVKKEANEQIQRLRRYSSLALLCGNNEVDEGWHNWGWQRELADSLQIKQVWDGYTHLFHNVLPEVINAHDSLIPYWPSSPQYGWGKEESLRQGDSHYWGVWWGKEPFETYKKKVPRFMSEFGFQSYPTLETVKHFGDGESLPDSNQLNCHQKHPTGFETINHYFEKKGWKPSTLEQNVYLSQVHQAMGYQMAIETHRMAAPRTMGTLYWQLNDSWPAVSWSTIDFAGEWKASHYQVKRSYSPILVVPTIEKNRLYVSIVNDSPGEVEGLLTIIVFDANGKKLGIWKEYVTKVTSTPRRVFRTELYEKLEDELEIPLIAHAEFVVDWYDSYYSCTANFDCSEFQLAKAPKIKHRIISERGTIYIEFTTNRPAMYLEINNTEGSLILSDNYFHLLPKVKYKVRVIEGDVENLVIKSLVDYLDSEE